MDSKNLKKVSDLLKYGDGKFLVVEDGEPSFVAMDIDQFKKMKRDEEDENFDAEEFMRNLDWDDEDRYDIDRYSVFDDNDEFDEDYQTDEDDEEGFSPDDIPFEDFLAHENLEEANAAEKNKDEIIIEPISNSIPAENSEKQETKQEEKPNVNLNGIPF